MPWGELPFPWSRFLDPFTHPVRPAPRHGLQPRRHRGVPCQLRPGRRPFAGGDLLLLTTRGARTGLEQTSPLAFVRDEDGHLLVVASAGGAPRNPAWYHNLLAHPMVRVEVGSDSFGAVAVPTEGAERARLFAHVVRQQPGTPTTRRGRTDCCP